MVVTQSDCAELRGRLLGFLACLEAHDRQSKIPAERLTQKLLDCKMSKEISANLVNRRGRFAVVSPQRYDMSCEQKLRNG